MKHIPVKWILKFFSLGLLILVIISLVAAIMIWRYVPKEKIRDVITKELSNRFNQDITMSTFSVSFYPNIEFVSRNMSVVDPPSSHEILSAKKVRFDLNVRELFNRKCVIENIMIGSPEIDLIRDVYGTWNVEKIIENAWSGEKKADTTQTVSWLEFGQVRIKNGVIRIHDKASGQHLSISEIAATIDVKKKNIYIGSASISLPSVEGELSGTVSQLSKPNPVFDIKATLHVAKEGLLADCYPFDLPAGETIADVSIEASGQPNKIMLKSAFSLHKMATAGIANRGTISGVLQVQEGLFKIDSLKVIFGESTLSLSGICSNIFQKERTARLEGTAGISLEEAVALAGKNLVSKLEFKGKSNATITLNASMEQVDFKSDIDLLKTDLNVPQLLHKQAGTPGKLVVNGHYTIPDELVINNFELLIGNAKLDGKLHVASGMEPWFKASFKTSDFPLGILNQLPAVRFEDGMLTLFAEVWQSSPTQEGINYSGEATIKQATLAVKAMKEPFKDLDAKISVADQKANVHAASFLFGELICRLKAEITGFSKPQVVGQLNTNVLDINKLIDAFSKTEGDVQESASSNATTLPEFSVEMMIRADAMHLDKFRTGGVSTTWRTTGRVQRFNPVQIAAFGGTLGGTFELAVMKEGTSWTTDFKGQNMKLEELWPQLFGKEKEKKATGSLNAEGSLSGGGSSPGNGGMWKTLNGQLVLTATNATFVQSSLFHSLLFAAGGPVGTLFNILTLRDRTLDASNMFFNTANGTFHVTNGKARTEDTFFDGDSIDFRFKGDIDFAKNYYDMRAQAIPLATVGTIIGNIPFVGKRLDSAKRSVLSYRFKVTGPLTEPEAQLSSVEELKPEEEEQ